MLPCRSSRGSTEPPRVACLLSRSGCNPGIVPGAGAYRAAGSAGTSSGGGRRRVLTPLASDVRGRRARRLPSLEVVELAEWYGRATFPYIPGLLTFREIPPLLEVFRRLRMQPDALLFDGHGLAHPRRFGLACHGGLLFDRPSVGCAKSRLVGEHGKVGAERGSSAVEFVLARTRRFRIPEPIRLAHHATTALRRAHDADALPVAVRDYPWFVRKTHSGLRAEE